MRNIIIDEEFKGLIPALSNHEKEALEKNIIKDGCLDALIVWQEEGILIDGHNRYEICTRLGIDFDTREMSFSSRDDVTDWMDRHQLGRRNLTPEQMSLIRGRIYNRTKKPVGSVNQYTSASDQNDHQQNTSESLAQEFGVSSPTVRRDGKFVETVENLAEHIPTLNAEIMEGQAKRRDINEVAGELKELEEAKELTFNSLKEAEVFVREKKRQKAEAKKEAFKADIDRQVAELEQSTPTAPQGLFNVIAIDPPWNYGREYDPLGSRVANPYPEMTQKQLLEMDIPSDDDCVMFLWTTHQFIFDAKELLDKWGFTYKATMVWDKERMGMGAWLRMQCEFVLIGIKGKPYWENTKHRDIINEPRREHSRKPEAFYEIAEEVTHGRRLEIFARSQRDGWEVYGNDTEKF